MQRMQVVEQEQRPEQPRASRRSPCVRVSCARARCSANERISRMALPGITIATTYSQSGMPQTDRDPVDDRHAQDQVREPRARARRARCARSALASAARKPAHPPPRADQHAACQRQLQPGRSSARTRERRCQASGVTVIGFRVVDGVGQAVVDVVDQVQRAEAVVRNPQRQRQDAEQAVDRRRARRVAVQDFVLQRTVAA